MDIRAVLRLRLVNRPHHGQKQNQLNNKITVSQFQHQHGQHQPIPKKCKPPLLLTRSQVPDWYDPNPYILTGYRPESHSFWTSVESWTYLHNESGNIYSHLVPGILLLLGQGILYHHVRGTGSSRNENGNEYYYPYQLAGFDWAILALHLLTAALCQLVSAFYHTLSNHSEDTAQRWLQLDYVGILNLILGNFISGLHFGFYCEPALKYFYWGLVRIIT